MVINFEGHAYSFEVDNIDLQQARYLKRQLGLTFRQFQDGLKELDPDALAGLYALLVMQNGKAVDVHKVNFKLVEFADAFSAAQEDEKENPTAAPRASRTSK